MGKVIDSHYLAITAIVTVSVSACFWCNRFFFVSRENHDLGFFPDFAFFLRCFCRWVINSYSS